MPASTSPKITRAITVHRALVVENEALYFTDGTPIGPETAESDTRCFEALLALMAAPCLCPEDVQAKLAHLMDRSLRERGPLILDLYDDDGNAFFDFSGDPEDSPFVRFVSGLFAPTAAANFFKSAA